MLSGDDTVVTVKQENKQVAEGDTTQQPQDNKTGVEEERRSKKTTRRTFSDEQVRS